MGSRKDYSIFDARIPTLTKRLRELIENNGGATKFAEKIGCSSAAVNHWYNGTRTPDAEALVKIGKVTCVSVDYLLGLSDCPSLDEDIKRVCAYTGLSSEAVKVLHYMTLDNADFCISDVPANNKLNIDFINRELGTCYKLNSTGDLNIDDFDTERLYPIQSIFYVMERYITANNAERELSQAEEAMTDEEKSSAGGYKKYMQRTNLAKKAVTISGPITHTLCVGELYHEYLIAAIRKHLDFYTQKQRDDVEE